jgi:hypothetical protein
MANNKQGDDLFDLLRERGVRKKVARSVARLEGDGASDGGLARKAVEDLDAAAAEIRKRVMPTAGERGRRVRATGSARPGKATPTKRKATARKTGRPRTRTQTRTPARAR